MSNSGGLQLGCGAWLSFPSSPIPHPMYVQTVCNIVPWMVFYATKEGGHTSPVSSSTSPPPLCIPGHGLLCTVSPSSYTTGCVSFLHPVRFVGSNPTNSFDRLGVFKLERNTVDERRRMVEDTPRTTTRAHVATPLHATADRIDRTER